MPRVIFFNGPPGCGKDTAAHAVWNSKIGIDNMLVFERMSMPIKKAFAAMMGVNIDSIGNVEFFEARKEETIAVLDVSYRQWQIHFSESFMKPRYGQNIFAKLFLDRMKKQHRDAIYVVPDCGFYIEYETIGGAIGFENVLLVKIKRDGHTFAGDSRGYIGSSAVYIYNRTTKEDFEHNVIHEVTTWLRKST